MFHDDPDSMSPDERLGEVTARLAAGFLRLKRRTRCLPESTAQPVDDSPFEQQHARYRPPRLRHLPRLDPAGER